MRDLISRGANRDEALFAWGHTEIWCRIGGQVFSDHRMILLRCFSQCVLISPSCWFLTAAVLSLYHLLFIPWLAAEAENPICMWIQWFLLNIMWLFLKVGLCRFLFKVVIIVWWGCICLVSLLKVSVKHCRMATKQSYIVWGKIPMLPCLLWAHQLFFIAF